MAFRNGVPDLVLLEDISEQGILNTLRSRYNADFIYTYIDAVLIAVNPYRMIQGLYGKQQITRYNGRYRYEEDPHVYSLAEDAYKALMNEGVNQCIIITGESGSGKTENSKFIMQYIAAVTRKTKHLQVVKDQILESNPVLEAFGNAKTVQNNNSSRFGKYFEIQFNYAGDPTGGRITNYLLEKSRVVRQANDERNFHIFYQLLSGFGGKRDLGLGDPKDFMYLNQSGCTTVKGVNDSSEFGETAHAMDVIGISKDEQLNAWKLIAAVLHLGNMSFSGDDHAKVADRNGLEWVASMLDCTPEDVERGLLNKTITSGQAAGRAGNETFTSAINEEMAFYTRDAVAKTIYSRLFDWLVQRINDSIYDATSEFNIGVLDIYGFEIFQLNSFEQLCINFVNEKLQQIFIELTLKSEQEEYVREGIPWTNVEYFNNLPVCQLIEQKQGVMGLLDEECVMPKGEDRNLVSKLHQNLARNQYYEVPGGGAENQHFCIQHYAGKVMYNVIGFVDKNKDTLFRDCRMMLENSANPFVQQLWPKVQVEDKKKPPTSCMQFKTQVNNLVDTLMSCHPHYIRCIRPNPTKQAKVFDNDLSYRQVCYLGLLENVRVRRAGFAFRMPYDKFLQRFKMTSKKTWPRFAGNPQDGVQHVLQDNGVKGDQVEWGKTKLFIRDPQTLFHLEEQRLMKLHDVVKIIQMVWRKARGRAYYKKLKYAATDIMFGNKERRRNSLFRSYKGDYIGIKDSKGRMRKILEKTGGKKIWYASKVEKFNESFKQQTRVFFVTDTAIINATPFILSISRQTNLRAVTSISMSPLADDVFVLHVPTEYDYVYTSPFKTEIVSIISEAYKDITQGQRLPVNFSSTIQVKTKKGPGTVNITKNESLRDMKVNHSGNSLNVAIMTDLPNTSGTKRTKYEAPQNLKEINRAGAANRKAPGVLFQVKAHTDYLAQNARELSFQSGDVINITGTPGGTFYQGELRGKRGAVMIAYVDQMGGGGGGGGAGGPAGFKKAAPRANSSRKLSAGNEGPSTSPRAAAMSPPRAASPSPSPKASPTGSGGGPAGSPRAFSPPKAASPAAKPHNQRMNSSPPAMAAGGIRAASPTAKAGGARR